MRKLLLFTILSIVIVSISIGSISAQSNYEIPSWVKTNAIWWGEGQISDSEFLSALQYLINNGHLQIASSTEDTKELEKELESSKKLKAKYQQSMIELKSENNKLKAENTRLNNLLDELLGTNSYETESYQDYSDYLDNGCHRDTPNLWSDGYCHNTIEPDCPANKPYFWSNGFCYNSPEYLDNGCHSDYPYYWSDGLCHTTPESKYTPPTDTTPTCDPSYPDVCIAPYPPDLDCDEIYYSNFRVTGSDPHGFDKDNDGIGCEVGSPSSEFTTSSPTCDPSYPDVCIAPYPPDLNCGDIGYSNFRVIGNDPHGFDRDNDGIGCES